MTKHTVLCSLSKGVSLLSTLCMAATLMAQKLPIRRGVYVISSSACAEAPFAAITVWDGVGFSGPHESGCTSHVVHMPNGSYRVTTACTALGDGTPNPAGAAFQSTMLLKPQSATRFASLNSKGEATIYRRCPARQVFPPVQRAGIPNRAK